MGALAGRRRFTAGRGRMHGCAPGAGRPEGKRNGNFRHGLYTKETRARFRAMRNLAREVRDLTQKLRGGVRSTECKTDQPR